MMETRPPHFSFGYWSFMKTNATLTSPERKSESILSPLLTVSKSVPEKFGPGRKYRYQYRKSLVPVPENSREFGTVTREFQGIFHFLGGTGIGSEKKMVSEKSTSTGTGKNSGYRRTLIQMDSIILAEMQNVNFSTRRKHWNDWIP